MCFNTLVAENTQEDRFEYGFLDGTDVMKYMFPFSYNGMYLVHTEFYCSLMFYYHGSFQVTYSKLLFYFCVLLLTHRPLLMSPHVVVNKFLKLELPSSRGSLSQAIRTTKSFSQDSPPFHIWQPITCVMEIVTVITSAVDLSMPTAMLLTKSLESRLGGK